jgi:hypothetical protein
VNTCTPREVDRSIGSLESRPFVVEGDVMTFQVAGGMDAKRLTVALVVDGKPVRSATGCQTEWLGARVWDLSPFRGKEARVVVTDASRAPFGHLVVGAIKEWRAPP